MAILPFWNWLLRLPRIHALPSFCLGHRSLVVGRNCCRVTRWNSARSAKCQAWRAFHTDRNLLTHIQTNQIVEVGDSVKKTFDKIEFQIKEGSVSGQDYIHLVECVFDAMHYDLAAVPGSLPSHRYVAFKQLVNRRKPEDYMYPVLEHPTMNLLLKSLEGDLDQIPNVHCPSIMRALTFLGMDDCYPLIQHILDKASSVIQELDSVQLGDLGLSLINLKGNNWQLHVKLVRRLEEILQNPVLDADSLNALVNSLHSSRQFLSYPFTTRCAEIVQKYLDSQESLSDVNEVRIVCRFLQLAPFDCPETNRIRESICRSIVRLFHPLIYKATAEQISIYSSRIPMTLRSYQISSLKDRCLEILASLEEKGEVTPSDIVSLTNALTSATEPLTKDLKEKLTHYILEHIDCMDDILLTVLARSVLKLKENNPVLLKALKTQMIINLEGTTQWNTGWIILRSLSLLYPLEEEFQLRLHKIFLEMMDGEAGCKRGNIIGMVSILPLLLSSFPADLYEKIMRMIPHLDVKSLFRLLSILRSTQKPMNRFLRSNVVEIVSGANLTLTRHVENATTIHTICEIFKTMKKNDLVQFTDIIGKLMERLASLTTSITNNEFSNLVNSMEHLKSYCPIVCENIARHFVQNQDEISIHCAFQLLKMLTKTSHYVSEPLSEAFSNFLEQLLQRSVVEMPLRFTQEMLRLQVFPESSLKKIFSFEYLQKVDKVLNTIGNDDLEYCLMVVNRSVVIECPHLEVPWLAERFMKKRLGGSWYVKTLKLEFEELLSDIVGGRKFYEVDVDSPYHHHIDFECILNSDGQIVPYNPSSLETNNMGCQRVAVLLYRKRVYTNYGNRLPSNGSEQSKHRQLQILGYKVVVMNPFKWDSMEMMDPENKKAYLRCKLFS